MRRDAAFYEFAGAGRGEMDAFVAFLTVFRGRLVMHGRLRHFRSSASAFCGNDGGRRESRSDESATIDAALLTLFRHVLPPSCDLTKKSWLLERVSRRFLFRAANTGGSIFIQMKLRRKKLSVDEPAKTDMKKQNTRRANLFGRDEERRVAFGGCRAGHCRPAPNMRILTGQRDRSKWRTFSNFRLPKPKPKGRSF